MIVGMAENRIERTYDPNGVPDHDRDNHFSWSARWLYEMVL